MTTLRERMSASRSGDDPAARLVLAPLVIASFLLILQDTAVAIAMPAIGRDLALSVRGLEWVVTSYTLALAVFMLTGTRLAEIFGARRVFLVGLAVFTGASLAAGLVPSGALLIAMRVVEGVGSALMAPSALALIATSFAPRLRGAAIGAWAGVSSSALAIGPLFGALLENSLGWRFIFLINVPLGLLAILVARRTLPTTSGHRADSPDVPGLVVVGVGLFALIFALTEAGTYGWASPVVVGLLLVAIASGVLLVVIERRSRRPMLDPVLFRDRGFVGANVVTLLSTSVMCSVFFFISLYLQSVLGYSAVGAGAVFLPMTVLIFVGAPLAGHLSDRLGARLPATAGMLTIAAGLLVLSRLGLRTPLWLMLVGLGLIGAGVALTTTPTTAAGLATKSSDRETLAAGILNTSRMIGLAIGIATMGAIVAARWPRGVIEGTGAPSLFAAGLSTAFLVNAAIAATTALVALLTLRGKPGAQSSLLPVPRRQPAADHP